MPELASYATLYQLRERNQIPSATTSDDSRMLRKLRTATRMIDDITGRTFAPISEQRDFDWESDIELSFRNFDLLSLSSIVDGSGQSISTTAMFMQGGKNSAVTGVGPWYGVTLNETKALFLYTDTKIRCMKVTGVWGWHDDYNYAWIDSADTVQNNPLSSSATSITVNSTTAADSWGISPRFSAGQLIQIDSEWMWVVATTATTLTVVRGMNGTTAVSHNQNTKISNYAVPVDINDICLRLAAYIFAQDDADFSKTVIAPMGSTVVPARIPPDIMQSLDRYINKRVK